MTAQGWIEWQASSGRNKKAQLTCLIELMQQAPIRARHKAARFRQYRTGLYQF
ncbi:SgrR family transcriptional regulator [Vibrio chagasii]|nr:SgrR family transcriptional regulator [Vibrio chagasii]